MYKLGGFWNEAAAAHLRELLEERGVSVAALAERLQCDPRTIRNWLRTQGPPSRPSVRVLAELCAVLGVSVDEFRKVSEQHDDKMFSGRVIAFKREGSSDASANVLQQSKLNVFLCHASQDKAVVRILYEQLRQLPIDIWFDERNLLPGQDWELEIRRALRMSNVALVCLTPHAVSKTGYIQKEIRIALDIADEQPEGSIFIIPARLSECEVPARLSRWQWVDLFNGDGANRLVSSLKAKAAELRKPWHE